jgi:hypothetical protein
LRVRPEDTGGLQAGEGGGRGALGRFRPGASGNPAGRPKGSRNKVTALCADLLGNDAESIMERLIKMAKKGEPAALRLAVERLVPIRAARDRAVELDLPDVRSAADLVIAAGAVIQHAACGALTLTEAREFMVLLEGQRKAIETSELAVRIEALEVAAGADAAAGTDVDLAARVRKVLDHAVTEER